MLGTMLHAELSPRTQSASGGGPSQSLDEGSPYVCTAGSGGMHPPPWLRLTFGLRSSFWVQPSIHSLLFQGLSRVLPPSPWSDISHLAAIRQDVKFLPRGDPGCWDPWWLVENMLSTA